MTRLVTNLIEIYWQVKRHARDFSDEFENKNRPKLGVFILKLPNLHQLKSDASSSWALRLSPVFPFAEVLC